MRFQWSACGASRATLLDMAHSAALERRGPGRDASATDARGGPGLLPLTAELAATPPLGYTRGCFGVGERLQSARQHTLPYPDDPGLRTPQIDPDHPGRPVSPFPRR